LIVCDNHSHDRTAEIARAAGATVVFEPVNHISRARNSGAAAATGDWLVFVDADSHPSVELFTDMAKEIQSGTCFAGGATIWWDQKRFNAQLMMPILNFGFRWRRLLHGAFIFIETAAFRKLGGFSAETFAGEDWELKPAIDRTFKGNGETFCHSAPASHRDLGAEDKDLFRDHAIQGLIPHCFCATPHQSQPRKRPPLV
jgi:glycosyltransferase involved in cell wall biosynthesis